MGRGPCCEKNGVKKGPWTPEEDKLLIDCIHKNGCGNWRTLPNNAGLQRCGKSCRLRWTNYLRPGIKRGRFSFQEEETMIHLHSILGNKWSAIAGRLPGRTDNEIKNYWNTHIRKTMLRMGIDPLTHHHFLPASHPTSSSELILSRMHPSTNYPDLTSSLIHNQLQMQTPFMIHDPPHMLTPPNSAYYGSGRPVDMDPASSLDLETCTFQSLAAPVSVCTRFSPSSNFNYSL